MNAHDLGDEFCPMPLKGDSLPDDELVALLARTGSVAVVGASPNPDRTSHQIALWLMHNTPYRVFLVNPMAGEATIEGHPFYADLADLPEVPDMVDVFRKAEDVPPIAAQATSIGAASLWLQLGIKDEASGELAKAAGLCFVQNRCIKVEYARLASQIAALA